MLPIHLLFSPCCQAAMSKKTSQSLQCRKCQNSYKIINGVPILLLKRTNAQVEQQEKLFNKTYKSLTTYTLHNWQRSFFQRILESFTTDLRSATQKIYVDVGAGSGYTVIEMAKKGIFSIGIDLSLEGMLRAKKFAQQEGVEKNTAFIVADVTQIPLQHSCIDYVSCIMLLEHLSEDEKCIKEISRILKKNGKTFISVPNSYFKMWPFLWPLYWYWDKKLGHVRHYSSTSLWKKFASAGMQNSSTFYTVHLIKFLQLALSVVLKGKSAEKIWWKLEEVDLLQRKNSMGLNLNAVFSKK